MKAGLRLLVVECDPPEVALAVKRGAGATGARRLVKALAAAAPDARIRRAEPWFSDHDPEAFDLSAFDGVAVSGSASSAGAEEAGPAAAFCERAFRAGRPVLGVGGGMLPCAALLGAVIGPGPAGGVSRGIEPLGHPLTAGRRARFDALIEGGPMVTRPPAGAAIAARDAAGAPAAFACGAGAGRFFGCRYQPDATLADLAFWFGPQAPRAAREIRLIAQDPAAHARLVVKRGINADLLDPAYRRIELVNWLNSLG